MAFVRKRQAGDEKLPDHKLPYDVPEMFRRLRRAIKPFRKAMLFEIAEDGHTSTFEQLVACMISIRTFDEVSLPIVRRLFAEARTPAEMARLTPAQIDEVIRPCTFHGAKARQIHEIAVRAEREFGGKLPCDAETLLSFKGVGPKCANLVLGIACGLPYIGVDIHVHRVTNRWGLAAATTPEKTLAQLRERLPRRYWIEINRLLVPFGKHICTGSKPKCTSCPLREYCRQVGVTVHR